MSLSGAALSPSEPVLAWPEHSDDLVNIVYAQSVLTCFDELASTPSAPSPDLINRTFASHPLNPTHRVLSAVECEQLWNELMSKPTDTVLCADVKAEVLRQVRVYIRKGLSVLRKSQEERTTKRPRSSSVEHNDEAAVDKKRRKLEPPQLADASAKIPDSSEPTQQSESSNNDSVPQDQEREISRTDVPADVSAVESSPAAEAVSNDGKESQESGPDINESDDSSPNDSETESGRPSPEIKVTESAPDAKATTSERTSERLEADQTEQRSSASMGADQSGGDISKDEVASQKLRLPAVEQDSVAQTNEEAGEDKSLEGDAGRSPAPRDPSPSSDVKSENVKLVEPEAGEVARKASRSTTPEQRSFESENETSDLLRPRRRSRASRAARSARSTPQSSRATSAEPTSAPEDDALPSPRTDQRPRRRSTPPATRAGGPYTENSGLHTLLDVLLASDALGPFKAPFSDGSTIVLSPTDLTLIREQVDGGELEDADDVEQELAKMLANAVMGSQMDVAEAAAVIASELASFREHVATVVIPPSPRESQPQNLSRRRR